MSKGLKQAVADAMAQTEAQPTPVEVSGQALHALTAHMRQWSGWANAKVTLGDPREHGNESPWASVNWDSRTFVVNPDTLVINPNRVLLTVTPFRLRQEAVLTGAMLHEAGHARHTLWVPRTAAQAKAFKHSDGMVPTKQTVALARLMEEPRVEGILAAEVGRIGAAGLDWTMRASAAALVPTTRLHLEDQGQKIMDLITSWALRAGRQIALAHHTQHYLPHWVQDFTSLLQDQMTAYLADKVAEGEDSGGYYARYAMNLLIEMCRCPDDTGPSMVDLAREVLTVLFPETDGDDEDAPAPSGGCGVAQPESESESGDEEQDDQADPQEGEQEGTSEGESDEQESDEGEGQSEDDEPESGDEGKPDEGEADQPDEGDQPAEGEDDQPDEGAAPSTETEEIDSDDPLVKMLAALEAQAQADAEDEADDEADKDPASGAGAGGHGDLGGGFRAPTKDEREVQKGAERFLRDLISPTESSKINLTESPSATIDGAAHAAWKASGSHRDPRFFIRTRREVQPSPPVKIAILVDVSASMEELQGPSALLSWALASAALDLRNFAGRGQQVESTLIHWGSNARVIQANGAVLPGIRSVPCTEGTSAMDDALTLVAEQIPGFFDFTDKPVNRLLVQFTDWELAGWRMPTAQIRQALEVGVNMLTIAPSSYNDRAKWSYSQLPAILAACPVQRGASTLLKYNQRFPTQVWDQAATALTF